MTIRHKIFSSIFTFSAVVFLAAQAQAACSAPTGNEGNLRYDSGTKAIMLCDGTNWGAMGGGGGGGGADVSFRAELTPYVTDVTPGCGPVAVMDNEIFDNGGNYNPATYQFTVPADGVYHFDAWFAGTNLDNSTGGVEIHTSADGMICSDHIDLINSVVETRGSCGTTTSLSAGDTVWVKLCFVDAPSASVNAGSFTGFMLGGGSGGGGGAKFDAYSTASFGAVGGGAASIAVVNGEYYDAGDDFDTTTYKFTAPTDGMYQFNVYMRYASMTSDHGGPRIRYEDNSGTGQDSHPCWRYAGNSNGNLYVSCSAVTYMNAGDKAWAESYSWGAAKTISYARFSGYLIP